MTLRQVQRAMYLGQRAVGDYRAAERGPAPLVKRIVRRAVTRNLFRLIGNR